MPPAPIFQAARPGEDPMNRLAVALLADVFRSASNLPLPRGFPGTGLHVARVCKLQLLRYSLVSPSMGCCGVGAWTKQVGSFVKTMRSGTARLVTDTRERLRRPLSENHPEGCQRA